MVNINERNARALFSGRNIFEDQGLYDGFKYYDVVQRGSGNDTELDYGLPSTMIRGSCTLLMKAGFIFIQTACIPTWNVYYLLFYNLLDFTTATLGFCLVGYYLSFGNMEKTIFATHVDYDNAVLGWCATIVLSTLVTVLLAGRLSLLSFIIITSIVNYVTTPVLLYLIWSGKGFMRKESFIHEKVNVKDYSGSLLIHFTGSLIGIIGIIFLGRRVMRLREIQECSLGPDAPGMAVAGYFLLMIGLIAMSLPTRAYEKEHKPKNYVGLVMINNILAIAGSMMVVIIFGTIYQTFISYWYVLRIIQGGVAGIVMISAGTDVYTPLAAFGISIFAGLLFYWTAKYIYFSAIEDYCNIIAIHFIPGIVGALLPTILGSDEHLGYGNVSISIASTHLLWQFICLLITLVIIAPFYALIFFILNKSNFLRNAMEITQHVRALQIREETSSRYPFSRIFTPQEISTVLLPGYEAKSAVNTYSGDSAYNLQNMFLANRNTVVYGKRARAGNPLKNESKKITIETNSLSNVSKKILKTFDQMPEKPYNPIIRKSSSEPILNSQIINSEYRKKSTIELLKDQPTHKYLNRPWNLHQRVRLYGVKKTENSCNLTLDNIENNLHSLGGVDDNYSELIDLNDQSVKIIKTPKCSDEFCESISESEI